MIKPARLKTQVSSGGVIFRISDNICRIALIRIKNGSNWSLPKGIIDPGERPEQTAVREVMEETGLTGKIIGKIGEIAYWYYLRDDNIKCKKTVCFYLMKYMGGNTIDHDSEVETAEWFAIDEALRHVRYKGEREMIMKAKDMLSIMDKAGQ